MCESLQLQHWEKHSHYTTSQFLLLMLAYTIFFKPYHAKNGISPGRTAYGSITTKPSSQSRFPGFSPTRSPGNEQWPEKEVPMLFECYLRCYVFRLAVD